MEGDSSQLERGKEGGRGKKKRRGGTKFSDSKALRRSALRKKNTLGLSEDDHTLDEVDTIDEFQPGRYRKSVKMRPLNLDAITENDEGEDDGDREDWDDGGEEQRSREISQRRSDSHELEGDRRDEEIERVVSYNAHVCLHEVIKMT